MPLMLARRCPSAVLAPGRGMPVTLGGETTIKWQQLYSLFQVRQIGYEDMTAQFEPFYLERGVNEFQEAQRNRRRGVAGDEQFLAGFRARAMLDPSNESESQWIKYRQMTTSRLMVRDLGAALLQKRLDEGSVTNAVGPYDLSPAVVARVRARIQRQGKETD